ncbi:MAG: c-type cytochrome [Anaerolineae bacterium]|nr:c-type cytochrome [Anaerolineae bacterium]
MKRLSKNPFLLIALLALTGLTACSFSLAGDVTPPPGYTSPPALATQPPAGNENAAAEILPARAFDRANGQAIYVEKCAPCHGLKGNGDGPQAAQLPNSPSALADEQIARQAIPQQWFNIVTTGNLERFMPPFASLSDQDRWDVVFYALSLGAPAELLETGKQIYQEQCSGCHGEQGKQSRTDFSDPAAWAERSLQAVENAIANGSPPEMPAFSGSLQPDEIRAAAVYLRSFSQATASGENQTAFGSDEPPSSAPETRGKLAVSGRIVHAAGKNLPPGLKVLLQVYENMQPVAEVEAKTQADGSFAFPEVERLNGQFLIVSAVYQEMQFFSDVVPVSDLPQGELVNIPVTVYDTTSDTSTLIVERAHLFLNFENPGELQVVEMLNIRNPHPVVVAAAKEGQAVIQYKLPPGASNLQFQDGALGERYLQTADGFGDTSSIPPAPNLHQILFAYNLPYENHKTALQIALPMPVQSLLVAAPVKGVRLKSAQLTDAGQREIQGMQIQLYQASDLAANQPLELTISGWPASSAGILPGSTGSLLFGAGVFVLAAAVAGIFLFRYQRSRQSSAVAAEESLAEEEAPEPLLDAILALEDRYQAGELSEEVFHERRAELKARLRSVLDNAGGNANHGDD